MSNIDYNEGIEKAALLVETESKRLANVAREWSKSLTKRGWNWQALVTQSDMLKTLTASIRELKRTEEEG